MSNREILEFGRLSSSRDAFVVALLAAAVVLVVWLLYRRELGPRRVATGFALIGLRILAIAVVGWIALDPRIVVETTTVHRPRIAVLVDRSQSMATPDAAPNAEGSPPAARWKRAVDEIGPRLEAWGASRDVGLHVFGRNSEVVAESGGLSQLSPTDDETNLGGALLGAIGSKKGDLPAAVVLASDGGLNAGPAINDVLERLNDARIPVYAIPFGSTSPPANLRVAEVRLPTRAFRGGDDAPGTATIEITGDWTGEIELVVDGKRIGAALPPQVVHKKKLSREPSKTEIVVPFAFPPKEAGRWEVAAKIAPRPGERRTDDNLASAPIEVVDRKTKILLVAGASSREFQFLRSVLHRDKTVELSVWLQPGRPGVSQDAHRLLAAFPTERSDLFAYDVLVAVDPDWRLIDDVALRNLSDWIATQAAGAVFIAGPSHWGRFESEMFVWLLPVVPRRTTLEASNLLATELHPLSFTKEGESHSALALSDDRAQSKKAWEKLRGVFWAATVDRLKPGAVVWASVADARSSGTEPTPFVVSQFYGSGRTIYLGSGEFWRLRKIDERSYERLWTQLTRFAAEGRLLRGSQRGGFLVDNREVPAGADLPIRVHALNEQFQPLRAEVLKASATTAQGTSEVELQPVAAQPGRFEGMLPSPPPGAVKVQVPLPGGGSIEESFSVRASRNELDDVRVRRDILERIAAASGGKVVDPSRLDDLDALLPSAAQTSVSVGPPRPLWDEWWAPVFFVLLLSCEWILRKASRLA